MFDAEEEIRPQNAPAFTELRRCWNQSHWFLLTDFKKILHFSPKGQMILSVPTGSGKTTIMNLINRFYDVDAAFALMERHSWLRFGQSGQGRDVLPRIRPCLSGIWSRQYPLWCAQMPVRKWSKQLPRQLIFMTTLKLAWQVWYLIDDEQKYLLDWSETIDFHRSDLDDRSQVPNFRWATQCGHRNRKQNSTCHGRPRFVAGRTSFCHCLSSLKISCNAVRLLSSKMERLWTWNHHELLARRFLNCHNRVQTRKVVLIGQLIHKNTYHGL